MKTWMKQDRYYHPFTWPCLQEAFPRHYSHVLLAWLQSLLFGPKFGVPITHRPNQISRLFRYILWNHPCLIILCGADVFFWPYPSRSKFPWEIWPGLFLGSDSWLPYPETHGTLQPDATSLVPWLPKKLQMGVSEMGYTWILYDIYNDNWQWYTVLHTPQF